MSSSAEERHTGPVVEFDRLCTPCAATFDENVSWNQEDYKPHHDIHALIRSADAGCHLCSLILAQISAADIECLKQDLANSKVSSSQQIGVNVRGWPSLSLWVAAWNSTVTSKGWDACGTGRTALAKLSIRLEEDDYTNSNRPGSRDNFSESTVAQVACWIEDCQSTHQDCQVVQAVTATAKVLPTRLLDLSSAIEDNQIKLCRSQSLRPGVKYATLSHCWGIPTINPLRRHKLLQNELSAFETGIPLDILPKTFQDAVLVTRRLGLYYLWIDALCIIQDSPGDEDWRQEASKMGDVYANSYITLAATTSSDSEGGLLHTRNPLTVWPCRTSATWRCFPAGDLVISVPEWASEKDLEPLASRAWVFQEWLLSKRLLHFGKDQVRWQCYCLAASEIYLEGSSSDDTELDTYGIPAKSTIVRLLRDPQRAAELWSKFREDYSNKALTRPGDRLPALTGVARMAHKALKSAEDNYIAGLYRPHLLEELLWQRDGALATTTSLDTLYVAPTWSWASLKFPFFRFHSGGAADEVTWRVRVVKADVVPVDDVFGPLTGGSLILECTLVPVAAILPPSERPNAESDSHRWKISAVNNRPYPYDCSLNLDNPTPPPPTSVTHSFVFLPVRAASSWQDSRNALTGLLLEPTGQRRGQYRRIGLLNIFSARNHRVLLSVLANVAFIGEDYYLETESRADRQIEIV